MAPRHQATWLPSALLLLCAPGCWCLDGPRVVTGSVGGSLRVQCRYQDKYKDQVKYWCKAPSWVQCEKIVKASKSQRAGRSGRVSIRDYPANLTFTVTLERLTVADAGTYKCGIDVSFSSDPVRQVEVSVSPASSPTLRTTVTAATTSKTTAQPATQTSTALASHGTSPSQDDAQKKPQREGIAPTPRSVSLRSPILLSLLALVLLLLLGITLLAWRMIPRQVRASKNSGPHQNPGQGEPHYANLELKTRPRQRACGHPGQAETEYSTVAAPQEELHYTTVVFDTQTQHPAAGGGPSPRPALQEPEYSVVRRT
ncbi:PREDICTED: CMRF35-like molecule 8 [Condylura cristata]|uniref:CMRF35-like molecule 8 n=1 Tax=Condylura cristata TaxID=143302 RepID=UPI000642AE58|nr:PREDICTED: CMRF35-like molecule 8 [Condylura cristata]